MSVILISYCDPASSDVMLGDWCICFIDVVSSLVVAVIVVVVVVVVIIVVLGVSLTNFVVGVLLSFCVCPGLVPTIVASLMRAFLPVDDDEPGKFDCQLCSKVMSSYMENLM